MSLYRVEYRMIFFFWFVLLIGLLVLKPAQADTIHLKKGGRIQGVIISESEGSVEIRSNLGTIILSRGSIAKMDRASEEENRALESEWKKEREEKEEKAREAKRFEKEQRAKGMVKYRGTWVSAEKMREIEEGLDKSKEAWLGEVEKQRKELEELEKRLRELEARLERKESELSFREQQLSLREQNLLLQQQNIQREAERLAREKEETPPKIFAVPRIEVVPPKE
jgi:chromosome segregation ATPase